MENTNNVVKKITGIYPYMGDTGKIKTIKYIYNDDTYTMQPTMICDNLVYNKKIIDQSDTIIIAGEESTADMLTRAYNLPTISVDFNKFNFNANKNIFANKCIVILQTQQSKQQIDNIINILHDATPNIGTMDLSSIWQDVGNVKTFFAFIQYCQKNHIDWYAAAKNTIAKVTQVLPVKTPNDPIPADPDDWPEPLPLVAVKQNPEFNMAWLPKILRDYGLEVIKSVQCSPDLVILPLLSVVSLCVSKKAIIANPCGNNHTQPLNIYCVTMAAPGERKTGVLQACYQPVQAYENKYNEAHRKNKKYNDYRICQLEKQLKKSDDDDAKSIISQIAQLEENNKKLVLSYQNITQEALLQALSLHNEKMGLFASEGDVLQIICGHYSDKTSVTLFNCAYDGANYNQKRVRDGEEITLSNPLIIIC